MKSATATSVVSATGHRRYNKLPVIGAILAVALTAAGLGVGLSQHKTSVGAAEQRPGLVQISGPGSLSDFGSYQSGGLSFPDVLPLKVQDPPVYAFAAYEDDNLTPRPVYTVEQVNAGTSGSGMTVGTDITNNSKALAKLRAGEVFKATYGVIRKADNTQAYAFVASYTVAPRKLTLANQSLYDTVSFSFDSQAERSAASLPIVDVQVAGDPVGQYVAPVYKDASNNAITTADQLRVLPPGSTFSATYKATRTVDGTSKDFTFVTTYVVYNNY